MQQDSPVDRDALFDCGAILIAGPTASGKSALALEAANRCDGVVVNVDSMQVYRELHILSARPGAAEEAQAPHRLYGHVSARQPYSVANWLEDAKNVLAECRSDKRTPVFAGGTGLYFKSLLEGLSPVPPISPGIREHWRSRASHEGTETLYAELARRDPVMAGRLVRSDGQRIVRALEVIHSTGRSLADWQQQKSQPLLHADRAMKIVLTPPRRWLHARINDRFDEMVSLGAIDEARALIELGLDRDSLALRAIGAEVLAAVSRNEIELCDAIDQAKAQTRQYAKRQETWFRNQMPNWSAYDPAGERKDEILGCLDKFFA